MKMTTAAGEPQARLLTTCYVKGRTSALIEVDTALGALERYTITIDGPSQPLAIDLLQGVARMLSGAVVMERADVLAISDSLNNARGLVSYLAPAQEEATLAIGQLERAAERMPQAGGLQA